MHKIVASFTADIAFNDASVHKLVCHVLNK